MRFKNIKGDKVNIIKFEYCKIFRPLIKSIFLFF